MMAHVNTQHIAIVGESAVGKNTLIRKILAGDEQARQALGITGTVRAFGPSHEPLEQQLESDADFSLYQWQYAHDINRLTWHHKIYVLWRPIDSTARGTWIWDYLARPGVQQNFGEYDGENKHHLYVERHKQKVQRIFRSRWQKLIGLLSEYPYQILGQDYKPLVDTPLMANPVCNKQYNNYVIDDNFRPHPVLAEGRPTTPTYDYLLPGGIERGDANARLIRKWHILEPYFPILTNKSVIDVGANTGFFSAQAAYHGARSVLAIERNDNRPLRYATSLYHGLQCTIGEYPQPDLLCDWLLMLAVSYGLDKPAKEVIQLAYDSCQEGSIIELCEDYSHKIGNDWTRRNFEQMLWSKFKHCYLIGTMPGNENPNNHGRWLYLASKEHDLREILAGTYPKIASVNCSE